MRWVLPLFLLASCLMPAGASEPGQPLDCSDWVFLEPGLSCSPWVSFPCDEADNPFCGASSVPLWAFDNAGQVYQARDTLSVRVEACGGIDRIELIRHDGGVVSRVELMKNVWGHSSAIVSRTVDTHIVPLRRKVEPDASTPRHILTVHSIGYKFVP